MHTYNIRFAGTLEASGLTALLTLISAAARSLLVVELDIQGNGTTSAAGELALHRIGTAGVTGGGAPAIVPVSPSAPAFTGTAFTSWGTQPVKGALVHNIPVNANGQRYFWRANANLSNAIFCPGGANAAGSLGLFSVAGTHAVVGRIQIAEIG